MKINRTSNNTSKKNKKRKIYTISIVFLLEALLYYIVFLKNQVISFDIVSHILNAILIIVNTVLLWKKSYQKIQLTKCEWILFAIVNIIIAFFISGKPLFLSEKILSITPKAILLFFLLNLYIFPFVYNSVYLLDYLELKKVKTTQRKNSNSWIFFLKVFISLFIIWLIAGLAYFPGNITSDTTGQLAQAMGQLGIDNAMPALCTIMMRWLLYIWNNPFIILIAEILFMSFVISLIYKYLYENNISGKILYFTAIVFALLCNNLSLMTMIWKDIPFTTAMLWLTFELYRVSKQKDEYFLNKLKCICLILSIVGT